jgi:predicted lipoprotein with Yx(FWY)xxD motif
MPATAKPTTARLSLAARGGAVATVVLTTALALPACGSSSSSSSTTTSTSTSSSPLVKTASNPSLGTILVDSNGFTLYTLTSGGHPVPCNTACTTVWPPLLAPSGSATPTGGPGVSNLGRSASGKVVTYMGFPLFHFSGDKSPGQTNGNGLSSFGGVWNVIKAGTKPGT